VRARPDAASSREKVVLAESHRFEALGKQIIVQASTRRFFAYDDRAAHALDLLAQHPLERQELKNALARNMSPASVAELLRRLELFGFLVKAGFPADLPQPSQPQPNIATIDLNVSSACNMRCRYCYIAFESNQRRWAQQAVYDCGPPLMNGATARRAVDFLLAASGSAPKVQIIFFGGEPLLNFPLIRTVLEYATERAAAVGKAVRFSLSTNGVLIDREMLALARDYAMDFQVSLDGPPEIHDRFRLLAGNRPSYQRILANLADLPRPFPVSISARATLHRYSTDILRVVRHFLDIGFRSILAAPANGTGEWSLQPEQWRLLEENLEETARFYLGAIQAGDFFYFPPLAGVSLTYAPDQRKHWSCGAGRHYLCAHTDGSLYLCHGLVGIPTFRLGDVHEGIRSDLLRRISELHAGARDTCRSCWARYFCGGGCLALHHEETGDIARVNNGDRCDYIRRSYELSMGLRAHLTAREISMISKEFELAPEACPPAEPLTQEAEK
jgi:uncharacterized protein